MATLLQEKPHSISIIMGALGFHGFLWFVFTVYAHLTTVERCSALCGDFVRHSSPYVCVCDH